MGADVHVLTVQPGDVRLPVRASETIEAALVRAGFVRPRRGCRRGGCGQCIARVHVGCTRDERPIALAVLSDQQRADGLVLLCRAVPVSDVEVSLIDGEVRCVSPVQRMLAERELPDRARSRSATQHTAQRAGGT